MNIPYNPDSHLTHVSCRGTNSPHNRVRLAVEAMMKRIKRYFGFGHCHGQLLTTF